MRQAQHGRKMRGRGRKPSNPMSRTFDSVGPDTKVRGTASHIADRYVTLAREAQLSGDRVIAENYLQHAEHYIRIVAAAQEQALAAQQAAQAQQTSQAPQVSQAQQSSQPQNGQRSAGRPYSDEAAPANGQAHGDDHANGTGEASARSNENSGRRGRRRERAPDAGQAAASAPQPPTTEALLQGLPPSAIQPEAAAEPEAEAPVENEPAPEAAAPKEVKVSEEADSAPAKPAPKRRRRTKPTTESTGDPVV